VVGQLRTEGQCIDNRWRVGLVGCSRGSACGNLVHGEADYLYPVLEPLTRKQAGERHWRADRPPIHYCSGSIGAPRYPMGGRIVRPVGIGNGERALPRVGGVGDRGAASRLRGGGARRPRGDAHPGGAATLTYSPLQPPEHEGPHRDRPARCGLHREWAAEPALPSAGDASRGGGRVPRAGPSCAGMRAARRLQHCWLLSLHGIPASAQCGQEALAR
jgi:hypothetical protein